MEKMKPKGPTRIAKLQGFDNVLCGRDLANIFKEGHVYGVQEILGQIIIKDLGEHGQMEQFIGQDLSMIMMDGSHCLTVDELSRTK